MGQPRRFWFFSFFQTHILHKNLDVSGIRTRTVGIEGEHANHLTTTTDPVSRMVASGLSFITDVYLLLLNV